MKQNDSSSKRTPIQASLKESEGFVHQTFLNKKKETKAMFEVGDLVRAADNSLILEKVIQQIVLTNCIHLQETLMKQYQLIIINFHSKLIAKHCRRNWS